MERLKGRVAGGQTETRICRGTGRTPLNHAAYVKIVWLALWLLPTRSREKVLSLATQSVVPSQQHWIHQGACDKCRISGSTPNLLNPNPYFNKTTGCFTHIVKFEQVHLSILDRDGNILCLTSWSSRREPFPCAHDFSGHWRAILH